MSKRKRTQHKTAWKSEIEWLNHREGYPTPEEREAIIQMRKELMFEIIQLMIVNAPKEDSHHQALITKYGADEVLLAFDRLQKNMGHYTRTASDVNGRRSYREGFARFGAGLQYYTPQEIEDLLDKHLAWLKDNMLQQRSLVVKGHSSVEHLLLSGWQDWADFTPLAIPPRPADFDCPAPGSYSSPVSKLLAYGPDLNLQYDLSDPKWRKAIPALTRMALDPGLLHGWPSESASWAPWHAIHILGLLEAGESAPALAQLADLEDDWLSDHLPHIWADMEPGSIPSLWMILEDRTASTKTRGLAAEALYNLAEDDEAMTRLVTKGFGKILQWETNFDPRLNGYLISFLKDMEGAVDELEDEITDAFEAGCVDESYVTFEDVFGYDEEEEKTSDR